VYDTRRKRAKRQVVTMTPSQLKRRPWLALAVVVLFLVGLAGLLSLAPYDPDFQRDLASSIALVFAFAAFNVVGALIIWRRPGNTLGWIMAAVGLLAAWGALADTYADFAYDAGQRSDPLFLVSVWISLWYWYPLVGFILVFTPLLFPDGRPPSPRWRPVVWLAGLNLVLITFLAAFQERIEFSTISMDNPVGIAGVEDPEHSRFGSALFGLLLVALAAALVSVVVRYLRSEGVERHQIKWLLLPTVLAVLLLVSEELIGVSSDSSVPFAIVAALFPIAIAVAILRYRLYDIDVVINRTLVYGSLTAMLAVVYFGGVTATQAIFRTLTGQEEQPQLAIVVSTLVIAALFNPLRRRIQSFIDRRFYRRKYDARKTLEAFSAKLRDETDLDALCDDLTSVVSETMQPVHVSLWLRPDTASKKDEAPG
jgi:ABC-type multidrug transport system fused ATPase/permease subunit